MNKKEKSLSDLIADTLYENCCKGKQCKNCNLDKFVQITLGLTYFKKR